MITFYQLFIKSAWWRAWEPIGFLFHDLADVRPTQARYTHLGCRTRIRELPLLIPKASLSVIYDRLDHQGDWVDDMYEFFDSPAEAIERFTAYAETDPESYANPRLALTIQPIPGQWGTMQ